MKPLLSRVGVFLLFPESSQVSPLKREEKKQNIPAAMLRADPHKLPSQRHQRAGDGVWSLGVLQLVLLGHAGGQETRVAITRCLFSG